MIEKFASVASPSLSFGTGNRQAPIKPAMRGSTSCAKPLALPLTVLPLSVTVRLSVTLPRALSTGDAGFVMLGVDEQRVWFSLPDQSTWAAPVRSRVWLQLNWDLEILDGGAYVVTPSVAEYERVEAGLGDFRAVDTGESLEDFYADGGTFSFGDAGAPRELVLGHRSAKDGGTGVLRVTGVTLSAW